MPNAQVVSPPAPAPAPAPAPSPAPAESSVPAWMNVKNPDGSWNMGGLFFWLVMLAVLVMVLQSYGLVRLWAEQKIAPDGKGEDFYSDL